MKQFRVPYTVSDGILNMRSGPSQNAPLIAAVPVGERGLQQAGECQAFRRWFGSGGMVLRPMARERRLDFLERFDARGGASSQICGTTVSYSPEPKSHEPTVSSGSAFFFVASSGQLLTNAHVVKDCNAVRIDQPGFTELTPVTVLARDTTNDLALLQASTTLHAPTPPAFCRHIRLGEDVFVFGYPLTGIVASSGNFTRGSVTAYGGPAG